MLEIRAATERDFPTITQIYAHHVLHGTGTFALEPPSRADMLAQFGQISALRLPYLVAVEHGEVIGFAYASPFRPRPGYRYGVEDSVYIAPGYPGRGLGKALLTRLIELCTERGLYTMMAVIGDSENGASIGVHRACGFSQTGLLPRAGYKFGRWLDVVFMTRDLLPPTTTPQGEGWAG
ncbi:GNAT family N-acetyltransferase [Asticcacaulis sp. EMRT-3]|uniref:GNAT family N-acetyltransferase n=1 Tax=Asticcacaulis sp. EMRT-3 TaxID=3040349 RepID=UPI0024AFB445|nr:GNAT family N-acetyltransferase [Asticcacaulis sp. EMRT-3]MDI7774630.1 GNAT family N-acetyltransferase [Asticcacaulis sp. EMRT-3]